MKATHPLRAGTITAAELYLSVGVALSWWEASEDILMGVFNRLCGEHEPTAFEAYISAPRAGRGKMLLSALKRYKGRFSDSEIAEIRSAIRALDALAPMRNQIAHGHVSDYSATVDDVLVMSGHFLVPSLNEQGRYVRRDLRYAHTAVEIDDWRDRVRAERARIMDADMSALKREQETLGATPQPEQDTLHLAQILVHNQHLAAQFEIRPRTDHGLPSSTTVSAPPMPGDTHLPMTTRQPKA